MIQNPLCFHCSAQLKNPRKKTSASSTVASRFVTKRSTETSFMDNGACIELQVPSGVLKRIRFEILSERDAEKASVKVIQSTNEVVDPALGFPNPSSQCLTCNAKDYRTCEGHLGLIRFPFTILHPYFLPEVAQILNKICPGCKRVKNDRPRKTEPVYLARLLTICKYCERNFKGVYPPVRFKVSTKDVFGKTAIVAETKSTKRVVSDRDLPPDYWDFVPFDSQQEPSVTFNRRVLTHAQVYHVLKDVDPRFLKELLGRRNKILLQNFPLTPNCHRVTEFGHSLVFDERTRALRKMIDFRGTANELGACVIDSIKLSKIRAEKPSTLSYNSTSNDDNPSKMHGLRYLKEISLGKRSDFSFRMVCVGDPFIQLDEVGIPRDVAETMLVSERLNSLNWEKMNATCGLRILQRGESFVRRRGGLVPVRYGDELRIGDTVYRPLEDGDLVLVNRPPSIHPHSLVALRVRILPVDYVLSINPLVCSPLRGDFDGDSLHGFVPQSLECRAELRELVTLENQVVDMQSGGRLLGLSHDSLTAAHLLLDDGVFLDRAEFQWLQMFCRRRQPPVVAGAGTGKHLFGLLLPEDFDVNGDIVFSSNPSLWLENVYGYLIKRFPGKDFLEFLDSSQEVLVEWLSTRGFSVSLLDLYVTSDARRNMKEEILCGLSEAEKQAHGQLMLAAGSEDFLSGNAAANGGSDGSDPEKLCYEQQTSAALSRVAAAAFKHVFRDVQSLVYSYVGGGGNSFLSMIKAGSKGNVSKFVQQSMCLGYQRSLVPLAFRFPRRFTCASWNAAKAAAAAGGGRYVPYGVVEASFLSGLNPFELLVHSVTNRDTFFGGHADISGTLFRKLMFFMRDVYIEYDGTVRSCYGNQVVQFSYESVSDDTVCGRPVGSLAACAISEVAYSALDQPISALENSPLLNLKKVLECGVNKLGGNKTASLFLSKKLKRWTNGFEYAALEVKNHLEKLLLRDVVSLVTISYTARTGPRVCTSPWICYLRISKEVARKKRLKLRSVVDAMKSDCVNSARLKKLKVGLPNLRIAFTEFPKDDLTKEMEEGVFVTVQIVDGSSDSLNVLQDVVIPFFLETVIKGSPHVKKVDIMWKDSPKPHENSPGGELYLRVFMSENRLRQNFWRLLVADCLQISDKLDWRRSRPDDVGDVVAALGIDAARTHFVSMLESVVVDAGKSVLPEHLAVAADCLCFTGEFVPLNAKGLAQQRKQTSVSSPFTQACFSNPSDCFVKAAKNEATDNLEGIIDALSWGKLPSLGIGGKFDVLYSGKDHKIDKPEDVYSLLTRIGSADGAIEPHDRHPAVKDPTLLLYLFGKSCAGGSPDAVKTVLKKHFTYNDVKKLAKDLKHILHKYDVGHKLNHDDKLVVWKALFFHPRRDEKIGNGPFEIKVGHHTKHGSSRCFVLERRDGTVVDFSYHKCVHHALELVAPDEAKTYGTRWLSGYE